MRVHSNKNNFRIVCFSVFVLLICLSTENCGGGGSSGGQNPPPPPPPTFTTIDAPGAATMSGYGTSGVGINAAGDIAGYFTDANGLLQGFVRKSGGSLATIDAPGAGTAPNLGTLAFAINASGNAGGYYADSNDFFHSYIRTSNGTLTNSIHPTASVQMFSA